MPKAMWLLPMQPLTRCWVFRSIQSQKVTGELADKRFEANPKEELIRLALLHRPDYVRAGYSVRLNKEGVTRSEERVSSEVGSFRELRAERKGSVQRQFGLDDRRQPHLQSL